jgi:5-methylcytosine-specific restriction protein A
MLGGVADRATLPKGTNGRVLCRWCGLEVPTRRFTFCSDWCVHEWRLRGDPGYLRAEVLQWDRGLRDLPDRHLRGLRELRRSHGTHRLWLMAK